jgi:hypothetical protein
MKVSKLMGLEVKNLKSLKKELHSAETRPSSQHQTSDSRCSLWLSLTADGYMIFISQLRSTKKHH